MRKVVVGVIVAVVVLGTVALIGCGKSEPAAPVSQGPQVSAPSTGSTAPPAEEPKMSDAQLQNIINTVPQSDWAKLPYAKQVQEYAKTHPKTTP